MFGLRLFNSDMMRIPVRSTPCVWASAGSYKSVITNARYRYLVYSSKHLTLILNMS